MDLDYSSSRQNPVSVAFPADLTKEEFCRFQDLVLRSTAGYRFRGLQMVSTAVLMVFCLLIIAFDLRHNGTLNWSFLAMTLLLAVMEVYLFVVVPRTMRQRAQELYNRAVLTGQSFSGMVTAEPLGIRKVTSSAETLIPYDQCALYIEAPDMLVFGGPSRSIVIPARCLTPDDADFVRGIALNRVPVARQKLLGRLIPAASQRLPLPNLERPQPPEPELTLFLDYTPQEFIRMITSSIVDGFTKNLPNTAFLAFFLALFSDLFLEIPALLVFVALMAGIFLFSFFGNRNRAKHTMDLAGGQPPRMQAEFSPVGVLVRNTAEIGKEIQLPWAMVSRAVERRDTVDFYAHTLFLTIPKRCIPDMGRLRDLVDRHMPPKGKKPENRKD